MKRLFVFIISIALSNALSAQDINLDSLSFNAYYQMLLENYCNDVPSSTPKKPINDISFLKKVDENFPVLFHRFLKPASFSQIFNKLSGKLQYWIVNYIVEFDSVIDEDAGTIRTSPLNNENVSFYVGGQGQVIGLDYNHLPFNKTITTELMNVFATIESPNIIYKRLYRYIFVSKKEKIQFF